MQEKASRAFGDIDILVKQVPNKYLLVNAARVRAHQLVAHIADPTIEGGNPEKAVSTALDEIAEGKLDINLDGAKAEPAS
jgi:DNA-directed RNA polymerase omega subunit